MTFIRHYNVDMTLAIVGCLKRTGFVTLIFINFVGCKNDAHPTQGFNDKAIDSLVKIVPAAKLFYEHSSELTEIVSDLKHDTLINKKRTLVFFTPDDFNFFLRNKMKKIGITRVIYYDKICNSLARLHLESFEFDFTTNWNDTVPIHLNVKPCDEYSDTTIGNYVKRDNGNESWGLGNNWVIWYEHSLTSSDSFPPRYVPHER